MDNEESLEGIRLQDISVNTDQIIEACKEDPDILSGMATPEIWEYNWPIIFRAIWAWLKDEALKIRAFQKLAIGLPRGFGKTTLIKLFILWLILFSNRKFILVMSATSSLACNIISDIVDMLDEPNIKALFGDWRVGLETDRADLKKFGFRGRNIIIAGVGAGGSVRGLNLKNERPDVMLFEDIQKREEADSQVVAEELYKWMLGTAMKAKSPKGCLTIFIGNMYPTPHAILKKIKADHTWTKFICGGITESGESLWEELQSIEQLLNEYEADLAAGHPEIFFAEVLNDEEASANNLLDFSKLPPYPFEDDDIPQGGCIIIDPSNDKANSDAVSLGYFELHDNKPVCRELIEGRFSPGDTIREALKLANKWGVRLICVESNAYQYSLKYWAELVTLQLGIQGIIWQDIYSGRVSKITRILTMFKSMTKGEIILHPDTVVQVKSQALAFNPLKSNNVDGILDLLAYITPVSLIYREHMALDSVMGRQALAQDEYESSLYTEQTGSPI